MPGMPLRVIELVAREKSCEHPDKVCHGESCRKRSINCALAPMAVIGVIGIQSGQNGRVHERGVVAQVEGEDFVCLVFRLIGVLVGLEPNGGRHPIGSALCGEQNCADSCLSETVRVGVRIGGSGSGARRPRLVPAVLLTFSQSGATVPPWPIIAVCGRTIKRSSAAVKASTATTTPAHALARSHAGPLVGHLNEERRDRHRLSRQLHPPRQGRRQAIPRSRLRQCAGCVKSCAGLARRHDPKISV